MEQIIALFPNALQLLLGGLIAWFLRGRTDKLEVAEKEIKLYREMVDDLSTRLKEAISSIRELEEKVENLTLELGKYKQLNGKSTP